MPHCIVEYSSTLAPKCTPESLLNAVYQGALSSELFDGPDIKTRLLPFSHAWTEDKNSDFIHVVVKILSGRDAQQKKALSESVLRQLSQLGLTQVSLTVEILDIDRASYAKKVVE